MPNNEIIEPPYTVVEDTGSVPSEQPPVQSFSNDGSHIPPNLDFGDGPSVSQQPQMPPQQPPQEKPATINTVKFSFSAVELDDGDGQFDGALSEALASVATTLYKMREQGLSNAQCQFELSITQNGNILSSSKQNMFVVSKGQNVSYVLVPV